MAVLGVVDGIQEDAALGGLREDLGVGAAVVRGGDGEKGFLQVARLVPAADKGQPAPAGELLEARSGGVGDDGDLRPGVQQALDLVLRHRPAADDHAAASLKLESY